MIDKKICGKFWNVGETMVPLVWVRRGDNPWSNSNQPRLSDAQQDTDFLGLSELKTN